MPLAFPFQTIPLSGMHAISTKYISLCSWKEDRGTEEYQTPNTGRRQVIRRVYGGEWRRGKPYTIPPLICGFALCTLSHLQSTVVQKMIHLLMYLGKGQYSLMLSQSLQHSPHFHPITKAFYHLTSPQGGGVQYNKVCNNIHRTFKYR